MLAGTIMTTLAAPSAKTVHQTGAEPLSSSRHEYRRDRYDKNYGHGDRGNFPIEK